MVLGRSGAIRDGWKPVEDAARIRSELVDRERALAFVNREVLNPLPEGVDAVALDAGDGCTAPGVSAIRDGRYPLVQPLYLYVSRPALERLRVRSLARFTVENYRQLASTTRTIVAADPGVVERSAQRLPPAPTPGG